jgi:acetyl esterase
MPLNPAVEMILSAMAENAPSIDWDTISPDEIRAIYGQQMAAGDPIAMARVEDFEIPVGDANIAARLYVPGSSEFTPALTVFFHGGGWVLGDLESHDGTCRALARASKNAILSIAYRLAPDARYPTPVEDCFAATLWASANGAQLGVDATRLGVAGDSAGGNLAAAVTIMARDRGGPALRHQLLIYPVTDHDFTTPSYRANGGGEYFLGTETMQWFWRQYLGGTAPSDAPLAAILRHNDLTSLPAATVITAEYDPLRDEGAAYAERLRAAGVTCEYHCAPGMIHGFLSMFSFVPDAHVSIDQGGSALAKALA